MTSRHNKMRARVAAGLQNTESRTGRFRAFSMIRPAMQKMVPRYPVLSQKLRGIKEQSIANLNELVEQAKTSLTSKGCQVYVAETTQQAQNYILNLVSRGIVVKSKTNAGKEINITHVLEDRGLQVVETDLGDRINQLAGSEASHMLAPAIHIPIEKVTEIFSAEVGHQLPCDEKELVVAARTGLREFLIKADVGISGANAIAADTGSVFVTENEGNIRMVTMMPKIHIVIAGVEKIVPKLEDAMQVVRAAAVYGVGQDIGTYVSVISGVSSCSDPELNELLHGQGPREVHVVLLKEGRHEAIEAGFGEALYCINCGSCLNFCPIYGEIGEKYGHKYMGGRGLIFTAFNSNLEKTVESGLSLCIGCQKCKTACPVQMDTPTMLRRLREEDVRQQGLGWTKEKTLALLSKPKTLPRIGRLAASLGGALLKKTSGGSTARLPLPSFGLAGERLVPNMQGISFLQKAQPKAIEKPVKKVGFFPGCVVNYSNHALGDALLHVLGENQVAVSMAKFDVCCGIPGLTSGDQTYSKQMARQNVEIYSQMDMDALLFVCPSCAVAFQEEYPRLLADEPALLAKAQVLANKVRDVNQFLMEEIDLKQPQVRLTETVTYHDPCHLVRSLGVKEQPRKLIQQLPGANFVEMTDADTCCGFGGSFSLCYYDLSKQINLGKLQAIEDSGASVLATSCPGCMIHFRDGLHQRKMTQRVLHIVQLLSEAYGKGGRQC